MPTRLFHRVVSALLVTPFPLLYPRIQDSFGRCPLAVGGGAAEPHECINPATRKTVGPAYKGSCSDVHWCDTIG